MQAIDPRGPRFNQAVLAVALLVAFIGDLRVVVPIMAVVLLLGATLGPGYGPFLRLYSSLVRPLLKAPKRLADPRPPRFAALLATALLAGSTLAFAADSEVIAWASALVVAMHAGLAASSGLCVGGELYRFVARRRGVELVA